MRHPHHLDFIETLAKLAEVRRSFHALAESKAILGNDNHIGDIGEYWARRYYEQCDEFLGYGESKVHAFDIALRNGAKVSVKTITKWSKGGFGTQVKPLDGKDWQILFAIKLNEILFPEKVAIVPLPYLREQTVFVENEKRRGALKDATKTYPRFQWWSWLDNYQVPFSIRKDDCIFAFSKQR